MTLSNDRKELRKGEKLVVTISEVLHNTLLVFLEYRKTKFCGVLLNTSNRRGPYGIEEQPAESYYKAYGIDPKKLSAGDKGEVRKARAVPPPKFPQTIDTRTTYAQKIDMPPPRQIYQRRRRSKRKVRMDMMDTDLALKLMNANSGRKLLSHPPSCCCDVCSANGSRETTPEKSFKGKRKLIPDNKQEVSGKERKESVWLDGVKALSKHSKRIKLDKEIKKENRETLETQKKSEEGPTTTIKRSPVIKISYKSPGGKGRVLKIPSRLHSPTPSGKLQGHKKNAMHERARKVVIRAKTEHYKYLKDQVAGSEYRKPQNGIPGKKKSTSGEPVIVRNDPKKERKSVPAKKSLSTLAHSAVSVLSRSPVKGKDDFIQDPLKKTELLESKKVKEAEPANKTKADSKKKSSKEDITNESPTSQTKRQLRSLTPHVLLQPLVDKSDEISTSTSHKNLDSPLSSANSSKSSIISQQSTDSFSGSSGILKRKDLTAVSHSITVTRCTTKEGVQWCQGDVVWAKIMGFPWWPGIVRRIVVKKGESSIEQVAIVDWFQSKTVSHIPCSALESFSGNFKKRYSKKIKGNYKRAIQEAQEAEKNMSPEVRKLIVQFET